jgi:Sugar transferases involved in lipopolysaccharide synthesis
MLNYQPSAFSKFISSFSQHPWFTLGEPGLSPSIQRTAAAAGLVVLSPILLLVCLAIRLESKGSAIFCQQRVGKNGVEFKLYKFRSMYGADHPSHIEVQNKQSDREGVCKKHFSDPRVTPIGQIIRKLSIDELPQLLNVVKGEMALVGPRPALPQEVAVYDYKARRRLQVTPGLTGLWQVSGRADTTFEQQIDLDLRYVTRKSLLLDINILLKTLPAVISGRGAY